VNAGGADPALAQQRGAILKDLDARQPGEMSIHEEVTVLSQRPMMGVFNLVAGGARSDGKLDLGRGRQTADLQTAPGQ
jgi:hypothetical protein